MSRYYIKKATFWEVLFQFILVSLVFIFYTFDHPRGQREIVFLTWKIPFFLNYAVCAFVIDYLLLPSFLYRKKFWQFSIATILLLILVIIVEELVLEKIYFPTTKGLGFPGVFNSLADVLPIILILSGFKFAWDALVKQQALEKLEDAIVESELHYLKSQINPHFLFNNLNNLYSYAIEGSPKTPDIILELSAVLRYILYDCQEKFVSLSEELNHLRNFVKLSELQLENKGKVELQIDEKSGNLKIAPLILPVFVENAFKHSVSSLSSDIHILIQVKIENEGELVFTCRNNFSEASNSDSISSGIGLLNVQKRLELIYPEEHNLKISKNESHYSVKLTINLS